jgi:hypothetical protein
MNPLKGFREDLVNYVGRLREQVYPDLRNDEVAVLLRQVAQSYHQTESQAKARARDEAMREAAARGLAVPAEEHWSGIPVSEEEGPRLHAKTWRK